MATVTLSNISDGVIKKTYTVNSPTTELIKNNQSIKIKSVDLHESKASNIENHNAKVIKDFSSKKIEQILPFRVKFLPITIDGYSASRPAPIGIAVIGVNNYIL